MTQLWSDEKIDGLSVAFMKDDLASKWIYKTIATDMRNDYERALSFRNETIGNLQNELGKLQARIAELQAVYDAARAYDLLLHSGKPFSFGDFVQTNEALHEAVSKVQP